MCRMFAYVGAPVWLDSLLIEPSSSLVSQSMAAREAKTVVNGDGCGIGWYGEREAPGLYRDIHPAWSDPNLASLCRQIRSGLFLAHVRSATSGEVSRANCHPFALGRTLFMHNGQIGGYERVRRHIDALIPDRLYPARRGTGDSEAIFLAAAGRGLAERPVAAIAETLALCCRHMTEAGISQPLRFSALLSDGDRLHAFRWASDAHPPSLYWASVGGGIAVASEPFSFEAGAWTPVPAGSVLIADGSDVRIAPFSPEAAAPAGAAAEREPGQGSAAAA
ncbi:class II glutamine amidotransferase [Segnochrobactraceae bacterium EtOH-i3]